MTVYRLHPPKPPTGILRLLARAPVRLYQAHLGGLLGRRVLLLTHTGRRTGQARRTVLEVVDRDPATGGWLVVSGYGTSSAWYRNVIAQPAVQVQSGWQPPVDAVATPLSKGGSGEAMATYARRHPRAARALMRVCGLHVDGTTTDFFAAGAGYLPFIRLTPDPTHPIQM